MNKNKGKEENGKTFTKIELKTEIERVAQNSPLFFFISCVNLNYEAIETHMIEKERYSYRVIVFGRFKPSDIAIKIRKKMNRRVEILDYEEMEPAAAAADANQNPPPPLPDQFPQPPSHNHNHQIPMFPSLEHDHHHQRPPPMFPTLAANEYRSFSSSRSDFAVTRFPEPDMDQRFWHYGYEYSEDTDSAYSLHNYYEY